MNFLSIDCSTDVGSLFLKTQNKSFSKILQSDKSNNDFLMQSILDFFKENNQKLSNLSKIFINQGPGNFSGLRGSLSIAKGISLTHNLNLYGYNNFIWPCVKFFGKKNNIYSLIKFRDRYFIKKFSKNLKSLLKSKEIPEEEILKSYKNKFITVPKSMSFDFNKKILQINNLNIVKLDHNELEFLQFKGLLDEELIKPLYLT
jgi:tRNA threonylcarbamoyl adenosine modification protein YeaZ|tara:strand:+ start:3404 stop:4009 length:606 start_codon:yes stop_codon:yes gene_type:complete